MEQRDFFAHWEASHRLTRETLKAFPETCLRDTIIPGLRSPGDLYCHIYTHTQAIFDACVTGRLSAGAMTACPEDVDRARTAPLIAYADRVMYNLLAHAGRPPETWDRVIEAPWGGAPMEDLCLQAFVHEIHHRGQLYAMLRHLEIDPPRFCPHDSDS